MTIKEFALLAGVSVSTVSKIMNGKDASISARTREHVLKLAKEYNYVPYASAAAPTTRTLTKGTRKTARLQHPQRGCQPGIFAAPPGKRGFGGYGA